MNGLIYSIAESRDILVECMGDEPNSVPQEFQYLPPGRHKVRPTKDGKPVEIEVSVNSATVDRLNRSLDQLRASGGDPFVDFNHDDNEASGWLQSFRWGGDDPVSGGVRALVKWTARGLESLKGRMYRKFSPTFFLDDDGEIGGTTLNAGGLVNRPAFTSISPVVAKQDKQTQKGEMMSDELKEALATIRAKETELTARTQDIQAKELEIKTVNAKVVELQQENGKLLDQLKAQAKANAETMVDAACADGRIPPKDDETRNAWVELLAADPSRKVLLAKLPKSQVLGKTVLAKAQAAEDHTSSANTDAAQYVAKVKELATTLQSKEKAVIAANTNFPELYKAWREAGCGAIKFA